jgi:thiamine-monophosphate kinase
MPSKDTDWLDSFSNGLFALADRYNVALVGGDTVRGPLSITVQVMGLIETDAWLTRSGAKVGDAIFVSGVPGEAAAGLAVLQRSLAKSAATEHLTKRFLWPEPRVQLGRSLKSIATSAIDVSDGLLADLAHIGEMSGCGAQIDLELLPQSQQMLSLFTSAECEQQALSGGDDYELLFTVPSERVGALAAAIAGSVECTRIGRVVAGSGVTCHRAGREVQVAQRGYDHFS